MMNVEGSTLDTALNAFRACITWIEDIMVSSIPLDKGLRSSLASGEVLCNFLNKITPGTIKRINHCPNRASASDNLTLFLLACEEIYGIPVSRLFSLDDFEDILVQGVEGSPNDPKNVKRLEKVSITLFWLAKSIDQQGRHSQLPRLDYSAFTGLLANTLIHRTSITESQPELKQPREKTIEVRDRRRSSVTRTSKMGATESVAESAPARALNGAIETTQQNNNTLDEDEWQSDLDNWREKRRRALRMSATKLTSLEEQEEEENRKRQEAIRDRMRAIKNQRSLSSASYVPSTDFVQPAPIDNPGVALLTGSFDLAAQFADGAKSATLPPPAQSDQNRTEEAEDVLKDLEVDRRGRSNTLPLPEPESPSPPDEKPPTGLRELQLRLHSRAGTKETHWGMVVKATGSDSCGPFVVDKVKMGSSADVCEVLKGDWIVGVNGVRVGSRSLAELERLMDRVSLDSKQVVTLSVLRSSTKADDLSDLESEEEEEEEEEEDEVVDLVANRSISPEKPAEESNSDVDAQEVETFITPVSAITVKSSPSHTTDTTNGLKTAVSEQVRASQPSPIDRTQKMSHLVSESPVVIINETAPVVNAPNGHQKLAQKL